MEGQSTHQPTIDELRNTFNAMIGRLKQDAEKIPDELVGKAKLVQLEIFVAHSEGLQDPDDLMDFCLSALAKMKCSVDCARFDGLQNDNGVDLKSILFARLHE
jgi:hypothetical protein